MCHSLSPPLSGIHSDHFTIATLSGGVNGLTRNFPILCISSVFSEKPCEKFPKMCLTVSGKAIIIRVNFNPMPNIPNALIGIWFGSPPMVQRGRTAAESASKRTPRIVTRERSLRKDFVSKITSSGERCPPPLPGAMSAQHLRRFGAVCCEIRWYHGVSSFVLLYGTELCFCPLSPPGPLV